MKPNGDPPKGSPFRYLLTRIACRLLAMFRPVFFRRLEDHVARVLSKGYAPEEIRRVAYAAWLYRSTAGIDRHYSRALEIEGASLPETGAVLIGLTTPFREQLKASPKLASHEYLTLPAPGDLHLAPMEAYAAAIRRAEDSDRPVFVARYSRPTVDLERLTVVPLAAPLSAEVLAQMLGDALHENPSYYDWIWSMETRR